MTTTNGSRPAPRTGGLAQVIPLGTPLRSPAAAGPAQDREVEDSCADYWSQVQHLQDLRRSLSRSDRAG